MIIIKIIQKKILIIKKGDIDNKIINKNKTPLIDYNYNKSIKTKFTYKNRTKNYIYYS